jgi:hypothetical protein
VVSATDPHSRNLGFLDPTYSALRFNKLSESVCKDVQPKQYLYLSIPNESHLGTTDESFLVVFCFRNMDLWVSFNMQLLHIPSIYAVKHQTPILSHSFN